MEEVGKKPLEEDHAMIRNSHNDDNITIDNQFYLNDAGSTAGTYIKTTEQLVMEEDLTIGMESKNCIPDHSMILSYNNGCLIPERTPEDRA